MYLRDELIIYILVGLFLYLLDIKYNDYNKNCNFKNNYKFLIFNINILIHHILISFLILAPIISVNLYVLYLCIIGFLLIYISWTLFDGCLLSEQAYKLCKGEYKWSITNTLGNIDYYKIYIILIFTSLLKIIVITYNKIYEHRY